MRITRIETWPIRLALAEPYTIAYETVSATTNLFVRLHTEGPHTGLGCAAPDPVVTGETPETALATLTAVAEALVGQDPTRPAAVYQRLSEVSGPGPSVRAALDMAVVDLAGKAVGLPVWKLLGGARTSIRTSITIGILDEHDTVEQARRRVAEGFTFLKLKVGRDAGEDACRVCKVREVVGPGIDLAADANQGYTVEACERFLRQTAAVGLRYLEQPTGWDAPDLLGVVQQRSTVPIMADEGLRTVEHALALAARRSVRLFNIKLMKVGGIQPALAIDGVASAAGIGLMIGCLDECALGIAAGLHFALARPGVCHADLDGHLDLLDDPSAGSFELRAGVLRPGDRPGLGTVFR